VEGGGGGFTVSGVSRNRGSFVKCVAIQKRLGIPALTGKLINTDRTKSVPSWVIIYTAQHHNPEKKIQIFAAVKTSILINSK
jgi:hypothetical protein